MQRDVLSYDVVIVGAGPAGLAAAIRLKQLRPSTTIAVVEKAAQVGGHTVAGAVLDTAALDELLPAWRTSDTTATGFSFTPVTADRFYYLTHQRTWRLPCPPPMRHRPPGGGSPARYGIINPAALVRWLAAQAQALGVDIFPGFAAQNPLITDGVVRGVLMADTGRQPDGTPGPLYQPGLELQATVTLLAEGCRGHLTKQLVQQFNLQGPQPQTYALGLKEVWRVQPQHHHLGLVVHTIGAPLPGDIYGGGWIYHGPDHTVSLGLVSGLDYPDPQFSPHVAFQAWKQHPLLATLLEGAERLNASARALYEGGLQGMYTPQLPGALLVGDAAGTLNVPQIKGLHTAMRSGLAAAVAISTHLTAGTPLADWRTTAPGQQLVAELHTVRNIRPGFRWGRWAGLANAALETLTQGKLPWTLAHHADHTTWRPAPAAPGTPSPAADPQHPTYTDRPTGVFLGGQSHLEGQPNHLQILQPDLCGTRCATEFGNPCTKFCPAGVYEMVSGATTPDGAPSPLRLQINSSNCIHCKTCDIKDPYQIINWTAPEGGSGPNYS